jgi:hypothetical protein
MAGLPVICMPLLRKLYMLLGAMSSWGFVLLSFVLLFAGAAVSLFFKHKEMPRAGVPGQ